MKKVLFILGELTDSDVDWLIYVGRRDEIVANQVLIREGQPIDALYIVLDGCLRVTIEAMAGREVARLYSGEVVGEISFIDARPPAATVTAVTKSLILTIPRHQLSRKLAQDAGFAARFYRALAFFLSDRLRNTVSMLGYGQEEPETAYNPIPDDVNPDVLENLTLATSRFNSLQRRMRGY